MSDKVTRVLYLLLFFFFAVALRVWYLTLFLHEERMEEARKPMQKTIFEPGKRGTIIDRFGTPMALNRLSFNVGVSWGEIAEVPYSIWETQKDGTRKKKKLREAYVTALSRLLAKELDLEERRVEDLIYSKAVFYGNAPFWLKEGVDEKTYHRLSGLSRLWPGIALERGSKRFYPCGKVACDILGYMGAIDRPFLDKLFQEISHLKKVIEEEETFPEGFTSLEEVEERLALLEEKAYTIHDQVGIQGVEKSFEEKLRGSRGKKVFEVDAKGHFLKKLDETVSPQSGERITLSISKELQEYAEELLAGIEKIRHPLPLHVTRGDKPLADARGPWIRGGAIIAIDPNNGEVLALASHPRYDPNAFVPHGGLYNEQERIETVREVLESDRYLLDVWMESLPLKREFFDLKKGAWEEDTLILTWKPFLKALFLRDDFALKVLLDIDTVEKAVAFRRNLGSQLPASLKEHERLQLLDLVGLLIDEEKFTDEILSEVGSFSLEQFKTDMGILHRLKKELKEVAKKEFHVTTFLPWREVEGKAYLKKKRQEEREKGTWARPYLDHFENEEKRQFDLFWKEHEIEWLTRSSTFSPGYIQVLRDWEEMKRPLLSTWRGLPNKKKGEQSLALSFHPKYGWGTGRSFAFRQASTQGSLFKLVPAWASLHYLYTSLLEKGEKEITLAQLNPFTIVDEVKREKKGWTVGKFESGVVIPQLYKGGRLPRSMNYNLGKMGIEKAIATSSNPYFALLAGEFLPEPNEMIKWAEKLSYGQKTGILLPGEYRGLLPTDLEKNRTGLYATAIGQHTLVVTPLQTAVMLSALANGGRVLEPKIALETSTVVKRELSLPLPIQEVLWKGMKNVIGKLSPEEIRKLFPQEKAFSQAFSKVAPITIGKTSTSDAIERLGPLAGDACQVCHVWFGGIAFEDEVLKSKPDLVVIVHLRYGRLGKEALPVATMMIDKWREIKQRHLLP